MIIIFEKNIIALMKLTRSLFLSAVALFAFSCTDYTTDKEIKTELMEDIGHLASDDLEGRAIGTEGEQLAAEYLAKRFEAKGIPLFSVKFTSYVIG